MDKIIIGKNVLFGRELTVVNNSQGGTTFVQFELKPSERNL